MSELLQRRASELLKAREQVILGAWGYIDDYTEHFDNACTVIEGYQDLLRRFLDAVGHGSFHKPTTVSECEFVVEGQALVSQLGKIFVEAKSSIPKEKSDERVVA